MSEALVRLNNAIDALREEYEQSVLDCRQRMLEIQQERDQLRAELEKLRCELDDAEERASEAEERCAAEWEKDCGQALRLLAQVTKFEWDQDGSPADEVREHIQITIESLEKQVVALRAELARLQRNEDCVQRLIVWAAENGWNGVDNSKILDSFIIGLFDELRAELAAAKSNASMVETWAHQARKAANEDGVQFVGPNTIFAVSDKLRAERDALAADNARLRKIGFKMRAAISGAWSADRMTSVGDSLRPVIQDPECDSDSFFAPPAQSLAAHDAAVKVAVLDQIKSRLYALASKEVDQPHGHDMNPRQWAATCLECAAEDVSAMQEDIKAEADRIEREAANG